MMNEAGSENLAEDPDSKASPDAAELGAEGAGPEQPGAGPAADATPPEKVSETFPSAEDTTPLAQPEADKIADEPSRVPSAETEDEAAEPPHKGEDEAGPLPAGEATTAEANAQAEAKEKAEEAKESREDEAEAVQDKAEEEEEEEEEEAAEEAKEEIDLEAVTEQMNQNRDRLVTELFGEHRPRAAAAQEVVEQFAAPLRTLVAAGTSCAEEAAKLVQSGCQRHDEALSAEKAKLQQHAEGLSECAACYENLFTELDGLVEQVGEELNRLDPDSEQYQAAPPELQDRLANYRKGVEIIHRMFSRIKDRKKDLDQQLPALDTRGLEPGDPPAEVDELDAYVRGLWTKFHDLRDANSDVLREAETLREKCWKATVYVVKGVISAVDGIDSGLQNEPETRAALAEFESEEQDFHELIDSWFQAYGRLEEYVEAFFAKTGIETHTVEPGTPFDPETMEPQGTVESSELNDEDVAAVARRGFSLKGSPIRPVMVDVVKNK